MSLNPTSKAPLQPRIGDKVTISYSYWTNKGHFVTKRRSGKVVDVSQFQDNSQGYNVKIRRGIFCYWHAIDHKINKLTWNCYPEWAK